MMKLTKKYSRYTMTVAAVWFVSVVIIGGGYLLFYIPQQVELDRISNQYEKSESALQEAQLAAQDKVKAKQKLRHEKVSQLISEFSAQQAKSTELVFEIGRMANELHLLDFSRKNGSQKRCSTVGSSERVSEAWLGVEFQANYKQFVQFINQLESHNPVVFVEEIEFQRSPQAGEEHKISLELSFLTETNVKDKQVASATH